MVTWFEGKKEQPSADRRKASQENHEEKNLINYFLNKYLKWNPFLIPFIFFSFLFNWIVKRFSVLLIQSDFFWEVLI